MQERRVRVAVTALLLASILFAAFFLRAIEQRASKAVALAGDASVRLARMSDTIAGIGTAQQSYVAPGQLDEPWFERASTLTADLSREIQQARESLPSPDAGRRGPSLAGVAGNSPRCWRANWSQRRQRRAGQALEHHQLSRCHLVVSG